MNEISWHFSLDWDTLILNLFYVDVLQSDVDVVSILCYHLSLCFSPGWVHIPSSCERGQQRPDKPLAQTQPHAPSPYPGCHDAPVGAGELLEETHHADRSQQLEPNPFFRPGPGASPTDVSVIHLTDLFCHSWTWLDALFVGFTCCAIYMHL